jgi:hypothetical protein
MRTMLGVLYTAKGGGVKTGWAQAGAHALQRADAAEAEGPRQMQGPSLLLSPGQATLGQLLTLSHRWSAS